MTPMNTLFLFFFIFIINEWFLSEWALYLRLHFHPVAAENQLKPLFHYELDARQQMVENEMLGPLKGH